MSCLSSDLTRGLGNRVPVEGPPVSGAGATPPSVPGGPNLPHDHFGSSGESAKLWAATGGATLALAAVETVAFRFGMATGNSDFSILNGGMFYATCAFLVAAPLAASAVLLTARALTRQPN